MYCKVYGSDTLYNTLNSMDAAIPLTPEVVTITRNGTVLFTLMEVYVGYCTITSQYYPYDSHICYVWSKSAIMHPKVVFTELKISPSISPFNALWWIEYAKYL